VAAERARLDRFLMEGAAAAVTAPSSVSALVGAGQASRRAPAGEIGTPLIVGSGVDPEVG